MNILKLLLLSILINGFVAIPANAAGGDTPARDSKFQPMLELIEKEDYQQAIDKLDEALSQDQENPDLLNLLAYSHRKLGHSEIALNFYQKALKIAPKHRAANEYLGELYLHLGQLDKAMERLAVLDKECFFGCDEFDDLEKAIDAYRKAHP